MIFDDLRGWLDQVKKFKEVELVKGALLEDELGTLVEIYQKEMEKPCLLFDEIPNYPKGYRILANSCSSMRRIALTLNMPPESKKMEVVKIWRNFLNNYKSIEPRLVKDGRVLENQQYKENINLNEFPVPKWHPEDGGRYIGTGCIVVTKDPDSNWVNCGAYRVMLLNNNTVTLYIVHGKHGAMMREKYWKRGKPFPVAISLGHDPIYYLMGGMEIPFAESEYNYIGAIRNEPVNLINTPVNGIPVPANSEIVIEGEVLPNENANEGPFGEWTGYYATGVNENASVVHIKGVYHRNDPILLGGIPTIPPCDINYYRCPLRSASVWDQLEKAGVPGIKSVWAHEVGGSRLIISIAIDQLYAGQAVQAGLIASQCHAAAYVNKMVIVVDSDIDVTNLNEVMWAVLTRMDPREDIQIINKCWTSGVDPTSYPEVGKYFNSRLFIDACIPWGKRDDFPNKVSIDPDAEQRVKEKWPHLF
jgi:4-hydroxy-3-polyprenylbenzoate decarboxylase